MKKIIIIGIGGSGKSTLAMMLSKKLNIQAYHLDKYYWQQDGTRIPDNGLQKEMNSIIEQDQWILDGYYGCLYDNRFDACDTVIFLNPSRFTCLFSVLRRRFYQKFLNKFRCSDPKMKLTFKFLKMIFMFKEEGAADVISYLTAHSTTKNILVFRNRQQLKKWFKSLD